MSLKAHLEDPVNKAIKAITSNVTPRPTIVIAERKDMREVFFAIGSRVASEGRAVELLDLSLPRSQLSRAQELSHAIERWKGSKHDILVLGQATIRALKNLRHDLSHPQPTDYIFVSSATVTQFILRTYQTSAFTSKTADFYGTPHPIPGNRPEGGEYAGDSDDEDNEPPAKKAFKSKAPSKVAAKEPDDFDDEDADNAPVRSVLNFRLKFSPYLNDGLKIQIQDHLYALLSHLTEVRRLCKPVRAVIVSDSASPSHFMVNELQARGFTVDFIRGNTYMPTRARMLRDFENGKTSVLVISRLGLDGSVFPKIEGDVEFHTTTPCSSIALPRIQNYMRYNKDNTKSYLWEERKPSPLLSATHRVEAANADVEKAKAELQEAKNEAQNAHEGLRKMATVLSATENAVHLFRDEAVKLRLQLEILKQQSQSQLASTRMRANVPPGAAEVRLTGRDMEHIFQYMEALEDVVGDVQASLAPEVMANLQRRGQQCVDDSRPQ